MQNVANPDFLGYSQVTLLVLPPALHIEPPMRTLAIGDIHGCSIALDHLLEAVAPTHDDLLVTLGDYVNRGPDSRGVIDRLIRLHAQGRLVCILGNHEQMMLEARTGRAELDFFLSVGGDRTLASYADGAAGALSMVPAEHWHFIEQICCDWHETDTHFFVHANVYYDHPLPEQPMNILRWERFNDPRPHVSGKTMVCGHSSQKRGTPRNIGHAICIDTYAYGGGWLTCLDAASGKIWQANQRGDVRTGSIAEHLASAEPKG